jgi:DNA-damage-inducible protein J
MQSKGDDRMATTSVTIRMDEDLKQQAEALFDNLGMNMTTAFTVFAKAAVRSQKIPFEIAADPFYSPANMARLRGTLADTHPNIVKTMAELEAMEDE